MERRHKTRERLRATFRPEPEAGYETEADLEAERVAEAPGDGNRFCGQCGCQSLPGADICEACGSWLLKGSCVFCYQPISPDQRYCGECGNPPAGIVCRCGTLSIFDFCPTCDAVLTEQGAAKLHELRTALSAHDPDEVWEVASLDAEAPDAEVLTTPLDIQGAPEILGTGTRVERSLPAEQILTAERNSPSRETSSTPAPTGTPPAQQAPARVQRSFFGSDKAKSQVGSMLEKVKAAAAAQAEADKGKRDADRRARALEEVMQQAIFKSCQEARRHHGALKLLIPQVRTTPKRVNEVVTTVELAGWLCNAYGCVHPEGPQGCAAPGKGGKWIKQYSTRVVETVINHTEVSMDEREV